MADVAAAMGVAKGTVYLYVESKAALFDLAVRHADAPRPLPAPTRLPVRTPSPGSTLRYVRERLGDPRAIPKLTEALVRRSERDARTELDGILRELYAVMDRHRTSLKLLDRCAGDYPELARIWFGQGREALMASLVRYLDARSQSGYVRPVPDLGVAARVILETVMFWAVHRHWDPTPQRAAARGAEDTVIQLLREAVLTDPHA